MSDGMTEQTRQEFEKLIAPWIEVGSVTGPAAIRRLCENVAALSRQPDLDVAAIPFDMQAVRDGYWEIFHDDDCGETLTLDGNCPKCEFHPDLQSIQARRTGKVPVRPRCPKCGGAIEGIECLSCGPSAVKVEGTSAGKPTEKVIDMEKYWAEIVQRLSAEIMARFTVRDEEAAELWAMLECEIAPLLARITQLAVSVEVALERGELTAELLYWYQARVKELERQLAFERDGSNCEKLDRARKTRRHWQERAEKAEAELERRDKAADIKEP